MHTRYYICFAFQAVSETLFCRPPSLKWLTRQRGDMLIAEIVAAMKANAELEKVNAEVRSVERELKAAEEKGETETVTESARACNYYSIVASDTKSWSTARSGHPRRRR